METNFQKYKHEIIAICKSLKIKKFYFFGSVLSDRFSNESDVDVLISFLDNISIEEYTDNYFELHYQLRALFNREVDVVTENSLTNPFFIENINKSKLLIYEA